MSQSLLCHWFQTWTARWLPARTYSSRSESDFAEDGEVSWERNNPAIKSPPYEVFFSLLQKKRFCIINRVMHVQTRCMAAVLLLWIPWALRLVISLTMILVRWYELVSWFFLCCDHHAWCTITIVIPPKKPPRPTVLVGSLLLKGL